jgi:hypothetical protein
MIMAREPLCADPWGEHADAGRVVIAEELDHIIPLRAGGRNIESNLMPLCKSCHSRKTAIEGRRQLRQAVIPTTIVGGAPGSGKTTFVEERARIGDLVVDVDRLYQALSGGLPWYDKPDCLLPFVCEARDAAIARLSREAEGVGHAWVITGEADRGKLAELRDTLGAEVAVLDTGPNECKKRISHDERRKNSAGKWYDLVDHWWSTWQSTGL